MWRKGNHEDTDNNSNNCIGVTVHGVRPDDGATADDYAGANESTANHCAGEREKDAS
jgi:hypothetical protein